MPRCSHHWVEAAFFIFPFSHQLSLQDSSIGCLAFLFQPIYGFNGFCLCVTVFWRTNPPLILISQTFKASFPFRCAFTQIRSPLGPVLYLFLSILELILVQFLSESEPELEISWGVFFTLLLYVLFVGSTRPWSCMGCFLLYYCLCCDSYHLFLIYI